MKIIGIDWTFLKICGCSCTHCTHAIQVPDCWINTIVDCNDCKFNGLKWGKAFCFFLRKCNLHQIGFTMILHGLKFLMPILTNILKLTAMNNYGSMTILPKNYLIKSKDMIGSMDSRSGMLKMWLQKVL